MRNAEAQAALYAALAKAVAATRAVEKHGQGQGYAYARAEDVMREADRVLSENGVTVAPIAARIVVAGVAEGKSGPRTIFALRCKWLVAHVAGGEFVGEMTIAVGTNLNATPPQATSSAYTCCERDFYRALLRMPRGPEEDVEHPKNHREERFEESAPARPAVAPPAARKATKVLAALAALKTPAEWEKAREKWDAVLAERSPEDDCGYDREEVLDIQSALHVAKERVKA